VWTGLGGVHGRGLEQIGTSSDCAADGRSTIFAWYEMVPAAPIAVRLPVAAGNVIHARVIVQSRSVTVQLTDSSTGRTFLETVKRRVLDTSSADWIVEAPGDCRLMTDCSDLSLADFGTVTMFSASAEATSGSSGAIRSPRWDATASDLIPSTPRTAHPASAASFTAGAVTTQLAQHGSAFSVIYTPRALR
jgi:hypothetical protein